MSATLELLKWNDPKRLHKAADGFVFTPYAAIKAPTRRKTEDLTPKNRALFAFWLRRSRRGTTVVLQPDGRLAGLRGWGLDLRVVAWLAEQGKTVLRTAPDRPRSKANVVVVAFRDREPIGVFALRRMPE